MDKNGVFLCSGCGIGDGLDLDGVTGVAGECGATTTLTHECLCAPEGLEAIKAAISENALEGLLIGACSPRAKREEFSSLGFDAAGLYRLPLREQCTWSHEAGDENTQALAEDLVRMGMARMKGAKPIVPLAEEINDTVLVVGGGRTGLEASLAAAGMGQPVVLIELSDSLGGRLALQKSLLPEEPPYDAPVENNVPALVSEVVAHPEITVLISTTIEKITGQPGQFKVTLAGAGDLEMTVGAIVQATGSAPYDANKLGHLGYGASPDVITSVELEQMLVAGAVTKPSDGKTPKRIVFIQCAGSRDPDHLPYCSSECCATTLRQVAEISKAQPGTELAVIYRDIRTPGHMEYFFVGVQKSAGMMMTRGDVEKVEANGKLSIHVTNSLLGEQAVIEGDLVVLAVGQVPVAADGELIRKLHDARHQAEHSESSQVRETSAKTAEELAVHEGTEILHLGYRQGPDLPALKYGFPDSHFICFPYETRRTGVYAAGTVHSPMDQSQSAEDGFGAAMKAVQCIEMAKRGEAVHPRSGDTAFPDFFLQRCTQCKRCTEECPFGTLNEDAKGTPEFNPLRCRRCGICMGACPERIISFQDYSVAHGGRDDQGDGGPRGLRREAAHRRPDV